MAWLGLVSPLSHPTLSWGILRSFIFVLNLSDYEQLTRVVIESNIMNNL